MLTLTESDRRPSLFALLLARSRPDDPITRTRPLLRTCPTARTRKRQGGREKFRALHAHAVVSLPTGSSLILTRELFSTAVTRGKERLTVVASEAALRGAVGHPVARAWGLRERLWPAEPEGDA